MFDTPFDRYHDEAAAERREQEQFDEREQDGGYDPAEVTARQPKSRLMRVWMGVLIVLAAITAWWVLGGGAPAPAAAPLPVVTVATPLQKEITEWDEFVGRFEASRRVEVRPQVSGQITAIHFTDGQFVRQGAPLFTIDARTYRASLAQAQAQVAQATTALALSRDNLARAQRLVEDDAVAANEIDRLKAEVRNNEAGLAAARALVSTRALDVGFTTVRAPISGRISDRRVDAGNLVSGSGGSQATLLTTINAVDPVYFEFTGSEALFLKAQREGLDKGTPVEIRLQDETEYTWHGKLDFTDNGLDDESGTIRARALVDNPDGFLTPGLFGQMRLATGGTHKAMLVPDTAITTDQTRKLVLVVQNDGKVAARSVELGPQIGNLRVIESGLKPTEKVVIKGVQMAMPGQQVSAQQGTIAPARAETRMAKSPPAKFRAAAATFAE